MSSPLNDLPLSDIYAKAVSSVLSFLKGALEFDLLVVTHIAKGEMIVLMPDNTTAVKTRDDGYFGLVDSFCTYIARGEGADAAMNPTGFSVYAKADTFKKLEIEAYMAAPICLADGTLFGTLCLINRTPKHDSIQDQLPMIETFADVLGDLLDAEQKVIEQSGLAKSATSDSIMDTITPLYNRRGWDVMTAIEESRAKQYNQPLSIISIDLDNLKKINDTLGHAKGGEYISNAGKAIKETIRPYDIASRTGGDEYNILLIDCDDIKAEKMAAELRAAFASYHVSASIGVAQFKYAETLLDTMDRADQKMYADKRARKEKSVA